MEVQRKTIAVADAVFWPALFVSGYGLWYQVKTLNKDLPAR